MAQRPWKGDGDSAVDRLARQLASEMGGRAGFSRRSFLRASGMGAFALTSSGLLAACGTEGTKQTEESCKSTDRSDTEKQLHFSNWTFYLDESDNGKKYPTLEDFQKSTGIKVNYTTDINGNNEFFAKVRNQLGACEPIERDIIVLTDWMAGRLIDLGWVQELSADNIPNVTANLQDSLREPPWDPGRKFSVPWQSGLTAIAYNAKYTGEISSFEELVTRPDLKGKIALLNEMGDTMSFVLKMTGADPDDFSDDEWATALDKMEEIVASGQVRQFTGNDYVRPLNNGDIVACEAWSGDIIAMQYDNTDIKFVTPTEGMVLWSDNMMVPNKSEHKKNAETLMNYYYDPEVAARLAAWVNYICPVKGAEEAMAGVDDSLVGNPLIFPTSEDLAATFGFKLVDTKTREQYEKDFNRVIGA